MEAAKRQSPGHLPQGKAVGIKRACSNDSDSGRSHKKQAGVESSVQSVQQRQRLAENAFLQRQPMAANSSLKARCERAKKQAVNESPGEQPERLAAEAARHRALGLADTPAQRTERLTAKAAQQRARQQAEILAQRAERLDAKSARKRARQQAETPAQRTERLAAASAQRRARQQAETPAQRTERLAAEAARKRARQQAETPAQRNERLAAESAQRRARQQAETPAQRTERLSAASARRRVRQQAETPAQRTECLAAASAQRRARQQAETPAQRTERLAAASAQRRARQQAETPAQRTERLSAESAQQRARRQAEPQTRQIERMAADVARRRSHIASETSAQRNQRLAVHQMRPHKSIFAARQSPSHVMSYHVAPMTISCPHCKALRFPDELLNCCQNGKISLPELSPYPQQLQNLLKGDTPQGKNFLENIRQFNSAFAFASMGAQVVQPPGRGPYCFRIHGQVYHRSGTLHPPEGSTAQYGQVYILEGDQAVEARMQHSENVNYRPDTMRLLQQVIDEVSPYAAAYKQMSVVEQQQICNANAESTEPATVRMFFKRGNDQRRYNEPRHDEVAAIFVGADGAPPSERDIVVYPRNQPNRYISYMSANCDPMIYPLLFPRGDLGWFQDLMHQPEHRTAARQKLTQLQFYSFRLAVRNTYSPIHSAGKLFQQYVVDGYVKTEAARLDFVRRNQSQLRVDLYQGLMDHLQSRADQHNLPPGRTVILPSSFHGSPRAMQQNYQDAMAIIAKFGKPDLFLTFTCNPRSQDIKDILPQGHRVERRPDLVARVFKKQLQELLTDIKEKHVLGKPIAMVHVIEFQKRGLPHCHMLIVLDGESKLRDHHDIDSVISAEIPDPTVDPELHEIVKSCMIHGPCGVLNPRSVCMDNGVCTKKFPKEFAEQTSMSVDGYPQYRRRDNGAAIQIGTVQVDNRFVVPYNPWLSKKYQAHINLEACMSVKSVKYLFKYVYKVHDCANIEIQQSSDLDHNEISTFLDARYVSAPEAFWRLSAYHMHAQSHSIIRLAVHLPLQQPVYFQRGQEEEALARSSERDTLLTAWFKLNQQDKTAREFLYPQIPNHFVFHQKLRKWQVRKRGGNSVIARMYSVSAKDREKFYLRVLLLHVRGATSFEHLRSVDGRTLDTFQEACRQLHLLADDTEWDKAMSEAAVFQMPRQLRVLFATICAHCEPADPVQLWMKHKDHMVEDYTRIYDIDQAETIALQDIQAILLQTGLRCTDLGLPAVPELPLQYQNVDMEAEAQNAAVNLAKLNQQQQQLVDAVIIALDEVQQGQPAQCRAFFLDGPGGSGKTMVYNTLMSALRARGLHVGPAAWTGIAATLLSGGRTVHSLFKLPVPILDTSTCNVSLTSNHAAMLRSLSLFIIDEASMVPLHALRAIDRMLRDILAKMFPLEAKFSCLAGTFVRCFL